MTAREIIDRLAHLRRVETIVQNVAHTRHLTPMLQDLAQMVYVALLRYDPEKIEDLWQSDAMDYFITRIVLNQYRSRDSTFRDTFTPHGVRFIELGDLARRDPPTEEQEVGTARAFAGLDAIRREMTIAPEGETDKAVAAIRSFRELAPDYAPDDDVFNQDPERVAAAKRAVDSLDTVDRVLMLMYADCGSLRKLGQQLGISHMTAAKEIRRIRAEVLAKIDKTCQK